MKTTAALVSYLNTKPFIDGLETMVPAEQLEINCLPPAECATALLEGRCDIALLPVGSLLDFQGVRLLKDYCIGADGAVDSVFLFSEVPIDEVDEVLLDRHSRTSNGLARVLMANHWKRQVPFRMPEGKGYAAIAGTTAGVVIGDKAFQIRNRFPYVYDLSGVWKAYTGLPFAFAVWAWWPDRISGERIELIRNALHFGVQHLDESAHRYAAEFGYTVDQAMDYLHRAIQFPLNAGRHAALERYFRELRGLGDAL